MDNKYNVYLSTHQGNVRKNNEDNYCINNVIRSLSESTRNLRATNVPQPLVCSIFDGMGGEANGELASKISAENAIKVYDNLKNNVNKSIDDEIMQFVTTSNQDVVTTLHNTGSSRGGSTFVTAVICDGLVHSYSLGDSRMYLYRGGKLELITSDHTLAMKKYRANIYTLEEAQKSLDSHKLTSFLGVDLGDQDLAPEIYPVFNLEKDDKLLLCSDGLYDMCSEKEILDIISKKSKVISLTLLEKALENGGEDNITCMVIERSDV